MARRFLPALRGLDTESKSLEVARTIPGEVIESKTISYGGGSGAYTSLTVAGSTYGMDDRAAGWDMATVIIDGYERAVWVYRAIEFISGHASRLPFRAGLERGTDSEQILEDHPLYRVLNKQANPLETGRALRKRLSAQVYLSKRGAFVEVTKSRMGTITRLDLLPPDRVRPVPSDNGDYLSHFEYLTRMGEVREIDPERIRWVREPHPTDPFSGTTPLEPAGISIELDQLSRVYNTNFIKRDARPSGIVAVDESTLDDQEMNRIERRFAPGAQNAGNLTVVATGPGGIKYIDTTTRPRDMAYGEASQNARTEILAAFGLDESVLGTVAGRTFDNAEQALYNAWTEVIVPHLETIASAFDQDLDEEWDPFIDTSTVEVLELPRRKRREEARQEFTQGLRSANEYRPLANLDPVDSAYARALWLSPSKAPVPANPEDAAELGVGGGQGQAPGQPGPEGPGGPAGPGTPPAGGGPAHDAVAEARGQDGPGGAAHAAVAEARGENSEGGQPGAAAQAVAEASAEGEGGQPGPAAAAVDEARMQRKGLDDDVETKAVAPSSQQVVYEPDDTEGARGEAAAAAALDALLARQAGVVTARLESPKIRKGTRFWTPDSAADTRGGAEPIDARKVVDEDRWVQETVDTLAPLVEQNGTEAAAALLGAFTAAGVVAGTVGAAQGADATASAAAKAAKITGTAVLAAIGEAMRHWMREVQHQIEVHQLVAGSVDDLVAAVRQQYADGARSFTDNVASMVGHATANGARDAAASLLTPMPQPGKPTVGIVREWVSQRDDRVRPEHQAVDGTVEPVGTPFIVGDFPMRWPCDPLAPLHLTINCRCRLHYRTTKAARLLLAVGQDAA